MSPADIHPVPSPRPEGGTGGRGDSVCPPFLSRVTTQLVSLRNYCKRNQASYLHKQKIKIN